MRLIVFAVLAAVLLLVGCSSGGHPATTSATTNTSTDIAAAFPTAGAVKSGPLGGSYCAATAANWSPSGASKLIVHVYAAGVAEVSVQVVDITNNSLGLGNAQIDSGANGVDVPVSVPVARVAGVSLAIAGSVTGLCAVPRA